MNLEKPIEGILKFTYLNRYLNNEIFVVGGGENHLLPWIGINWMNKGLCSSIGSSSMMNPAIIVHTSAWYDF